MIPSPNPQPWPGMCPGCGCCPYKSGMKIVIADVTICQNFCVQPTYDNEGFCCAAKFTGEINGTYYLSPYYDYSFWPLPLFPTLTESVYYNESGEGCTGTPDIYNPAPAGLLGAFYCNPPTDPDAPPGSVQISCYFVDNYTGANIFNGMANYVVGTPCVITNTTVSPCSPGGYDPGPPFVAYASTAGYGGTITVSFD